MRFLKYLYLFCLVLSTNAFAGAPDTLWTRTYGGTGFDFGKSVQQTFDGGFILAGCKEFGGVGGAYDVYLVRTDSSGDTLWTRTYGGKGNEYGESVQQIIGGGFIIAGYTNSFGTNYNNVYLIRTNSSGDTLWTRTFGGTEEDIGFSVQQTSDSGFIITGMTNSFGAGFWDVYIIKTNSSGNILLSKTFGGNGDDVGASVQQTSDGGFIVTGYTESFGVGYNDVYLIKTDALGNTLWTKTFGGTSHDNGYSVQQTQDEGFIIAGYTNSFGAGKGDIYLVRINSSGNALWTKTFGGYENDWGCSVQQTTDGGFIIAGYTESFGAGGGDVYLIRTNSSGDTLWTKTFGGEYEDCAYSVQQTFDGGFIIAGEKNNYVYLIRLGKETGVEEKSNIKNPSTTLRASQNPFSKSTIISYTVGEVSQPRYVSLKIYDITGSCVKTLVNEQKPAGNYSINLNAKELKAGIYFVTLSTGTSKTTKKLTVLK
ncbi:MAG: T9SS type A sorting domain-containing protein [bacterium]|nr:T9SS type A sorting domain-containing protein [bacterium]